MLFNLDCVNNTMYFFTYFFFFLIIDLYFLIHAAIIQILNLVPELVIPVIMPSDEEKAEIKIHPPVVADAEIRKCLI